MEAFAAQIQAAFTAHGTDGLVDYLLENTDRIKEYNMTEWNEELEEACVAAEAETEEPAVALTDREFKCPHCGSFEVRDDTFVCMKTCAACATSWYYMTDNAAQCMDYEDVVKAREKVRENEQYI